MPQADTDGKGVQPMLKKRSLEIQSGATDASTAGLHASFERVDAQLAELQNNRRIRLQRSRCELDLLQKRSASLGFELEKLQYSMQESAGVLSSCCARARSLSDYLKASSLDADATASVRAAVQQLLQAADSGRRNGGKRRQPGDSRVSRTRTTAPSPPRTAVGETVGTAASEAKGQGGHDLGSVCEEDNDDTDDDGLDAFHRMLSEEDPPINLQTSKSRPYSAYHEVHSRQGSFRRLRVHGEPGRLTTLGLPSWRRKRLLDGTPLPTTDTSLLESEISGLGDNASQNRRNTTPYSEDDAVLTAVERRRELQHENVRRAFLSP